MQELDLSIIIVNYNGKHYLKDCLQSIEKHCSSFKYEIIIVDNLSIDGSQNFIKSEYPSVRLVENKVNYGFAKGNNIGVDFAKGRSLLLLNNDIVLLEDLSPVVNKVKEKEIGVIGIKMLDSEENYQKSAGRFPGFKELIFFSKLFLSDEGFSTGDFTKDVLEVDWVQGSFMIVKKEDYHKVNGLDETYFMYVEDVDFCKKIVQNGKRNLYFHEISYIHYGGFNKARQSLLIKGFKIYVQKHFKSFKNVAILMLNLKRVLLKFVQ